MKLLGIIVFSALIGTIMAQQTEGVIHYQETIQLDIDLEDVDGLTDEMKALFPSEQSVKMQLKFTPNASLYTTAKDESDESVDYKSEENNVQVMVQVNVPEHVYYNDLVAKEVVESKELLGKKFLITGGKKMKWKVTSEHQQVLGIDCQKATTTSEGKIVEVWFTTAIPLPIGPSGYHSLPGAVLAVSLDNGQRTITATHVDFRTINPKELVKPKKGKKVTREVFLKISEEKYKEMAEHYGGNGRVIMQTETIEK